MSRNQWRTANDVSLTASSLSDLFENKIAAVRIPQFASAEECRKLTEAACSSGFAYDPAVDPPIGRIGVTLFGKSKHTYFPAAHRANQVLHEITRRSFDPVDRLIRIIEDQAQIQLRIAEDPQYGSLFAGLIRLIHQDAGLHLDFALVDAPESSVADVEAQLAWNLYVVAPESGGECVVHNLQWQPEDERRKSANSDLYFDRSIVEGCETKEIPPIAGDAVLFNCRNFHEVKESSGDRITFHSFIGRKPDGKLVLWS
jgi:hypothetical protein